MFVLPNVDEIIRRRTLTGLSQHQLSLKAGLSGCAINRIENGKTKNIHHLRAEAIAKALRCKVSDIFLEGGIDVSARRRKN